MKESFIFYKSFMDAIEKIPQIKYRYLLLETIIKVGLFSEESIEKLESFCIESEQKLSKNYAVLGIFLSIKPQLIANYKKYLNGCKAKEKGALGGAPAGNKNAQKTTPKQPLMKMNNVNVNENVNENVNVFFKNEVAPQPKEQKEKKHDPFVNNSVTNAFQENYQKFFNSKAYLTANQRVKLMELNSDIPDFIETIPVALEKLKKIEFDLPNFTPTASWLLRDDNYTAVLNGTYDAKKSVWDKLREEGQKYG